MKCLLYNQWMLKLVSPLTQLKALLLTNAALIALIDRMVLL